MGAGDPVGPAGGPSGSRRRRLGLAVGIFAVAAAFLGTAVAIRFRGGSPDPAPARGAGTAAAAVGSASSLSLLETFSTPALSPERWAIVSEGDFQERLVDVVETPGSSPRDYRLRLRAATRGTRDDTVKYLGVRSVQAYPIGNGTRVGADLDWNHQANGCYLSAAIILSPEETSGNPLKGRDWVRVEYVGVPPGKNGRMVVAARTGGLERYLYMEGWPEKGRGGRPISVQKVELLLTEGGLRVFENGQPVYECPEKVVQFKKAHLYLQMSSHSNYPPREIFFDNVRVDPAR